jgi:hypothetical protein
MAPCSKLPNIKSLRAKRTGWEPGGGSCSISVGEAGHWVISDAEEQQSFICKCVERPTGRAQINSRSCSVGHTERRVCDRLLYLLGSGGVNRFDVLVGVGMPGVWLLSG